MPSPQVKPFDFESLDPDDTKPAAPAFTQSDIDAAYQEGLAHGRAQALASTIKAQTDSLKTIQSDLSSAIEKFNGAVARERATLRAIAEAFLIEYCERLSIDHETQTAQNILNKLFDSAEENASAILFVSAQSMEEIGAQLEAIIRGRSAGATVTIEECADLSPGECRLEWRSGSLTQNFDAVRAAVARVMKADYPENHEMEPSS
ncbi:MAG: hypothetical protein AAGJ73_10065 [Pseudomonadota bacterium]